MDTVTATFAIPNWIAQGLASGAYERVGSIIRKTGSKELVIWLREANSMSWQGLFQGALNLSSALSILNLSISVIGFALVIAHLNDLKETLNRIDYKLDLSHYTNFQSGIELANNAFSMTNPNNRINMASQAIDRLLNAQHIYINYVNQELQQQSKLVESYLLTLFLAYITEVRCHLEMGEPTRALQRLQEAVTKIHPQVVKYIKMLLTSNPAAYLQPELKQKIDLRRLTKIYKWMHPDWDENDVFEYQRENFVKLVRNPDEWLGSLSPVILERSEVPWNLSFLGISNPTPFSGRFAQEVFDRLPEVMNKMESMIETSRRFEAYQLELKAIAQLGISFQEWQQLKPAEARPSEDTNLMYIIPSQPLEL